MRSEYGGSLGQGLVCDAVHVVQAHVAQGLGQGQPSLVGLKL